MSCLCTEGPMYLCPIHGLASRDFDTKQDTRPRRRKPLRTESQKQVSRTSFVYGGKAERIRYMVVAKGEPWCECGCESPLSGFGVLAPIDMDLAELVEFYMGELDAHHVISRDKGRGYYSSADHGVDSPTNIQLLRRSHHSRTEPEPEWSTT